MIYFKYMRDDIIESKLRILKKSKFRSSFHLRKYMINYIDEKGINVIKQHTRDFIIQKLLNTNPNDGHQTPMKSHPSFIAMHATSTCCRECLYKFHHISKDKTLTSNEINYIEQLILTWIKQDYKEYKNGKKK